MKRVPPWLAALGCLLLASCGQVLLPRAEQSKPLGMVTSSDALNPNLQLTPTPPNQRFPGLTPALLGSATPMPTPNPIVTPHSYVKEHTYGDLLNDGQQSLIIIAGDRRPSPPATPTPVLQHQKGEYEGNFTYNLEVWSWNPTTNQYALAASWPNDPTKRYIDMRYHLLDLTGDGTQQILVQARVEGVAEALDWQLLRYGNKKLTPIFGQTGLEHGQVRIIGKNIWQEQAVRDPNQDPCCPSQYRDDAFIWNGSTFTPTKSFIFPTPSSFPQPTPTPLSSQATPVPLSAVSVPIPPR
ncbi:MAG: hypothetical protein KGJ86_21670 [Chloroflexota bacterium]|nr:hypothetical protein [Chloroflexota bacterium]